MIDIIDLFAGAGGFSHGARTSGCQIGNMIGIEIDVDAVATRTAAGFDSITADLTQFDPASIPLQDGHRLHIHASPPCTTFSAAGSKKGNSFTSVLIDAVNAIFDGEDYGDVIARMPPQIDSTSLLVLVPARWIMCLRPDSISFEQVRAVMPIWETYASALNKIGYHTWTALLAAEQYGLPQSRTRAWLGASRHHDVRPPEPTHSSYNFRDAGQIHQSLLPPVTMIEAFSQFPDDYSNFTHYAPAGVSQSRNQARPRPIRFAPAPTVTSQCNHYLYNADDLQFGKKIADYNNINYRKITVAEAAVLQGFPADYPFQGKKVSQVRQIGNSVPPPVAAQVLLSLLEAWH